jgi:hypothetical protein
MVWRRLEHPNASPYPIGSAGVEDALHDYVIDIITHHGV